MASGSALFGTSIEDGPFGRGTVYKINKDGTGFQLLHAFAQASDNGSPYWTSSNYYDVWTNTDGTQPNGLTVSMNTLYGSCDYGGSFGYGTLFKLNVDGTGFTLLHTFSAPDPNDGTNPDGIAPVGRKVVSGNRLYGTTYRGGAGGSGTIYFVNTDGTGFTTIYNFSAADPATGTNPDGVDPGDILLIGDTLYGTAASGGNSGRGTVFAINTNGSGFIVLHSFSGMDGDGPSPGLILSSNILYGTTYQGGESGNGTVFSINTDGSQFTSLYSFSAFGLKHTNSDGAQPSSELVLAGDTLYGSANQGGAFGSGTLFALNTDGAGFTNLYSFSAASGASNTNRDGAYPSGQLILFGSRLYGTTQVGGYWGAGTVFGFSLGPGSIPQLTVTPLGPNVLISWSTNFTGYVLQSATTLANGGDWQNSTLVSTQNNGQNIVSLNSTGTAGFFRLHHL